MKDLGYRGISFPFRIDSATGKVSMSEANSARVAHITESITQILRTKKFERTMEFHVYSDVDIVVFEPNDISAQTLLEFEIKEALTRLEPRIEIVSIDLTVIAENGLFANIVFKMLPYNNIFTVNTKVGDLVVQ